MKKFLIVIYGKDGCELCLRLKKEVGLMLEEADFSDNFDLDYQNLSTAEGMQAYAAAETVNGQRIPALQIMEYSEAKNCYVKILDPRPEVSDNEGCSAFVPGYLQLQTDYSSKEPAISREQVKELVSLAGAYPS